jgi:DNA invertase Pin-like site-specific DNA recombinase
MVERLNEMGVHLVSIKEQLDTTTATGKLMLTMLSALSQFERDLLAERTEDGLKSARARGRVGGRPQAGDEKTKKTALALYKANTMTNGEIAEQVGVSRATLQRWIREAKED